MPTISRHWDFFIPLNRDLPPDLEERISSESEPIPSTVDVRQVLFDKHSVDGYVLCPGCLMSLNQPYLKLMHVDHIVPKSRGGRHTWSNVQLLCGACNSSKQDRPNTLFLQRQTIRDWEEAIRATAEEHPNDELDGRWAYSLHVACYLNRIATDYDALPPVKLVDLVALTLDALKGVVWKRRSEVVQSSFRKQFANEFLEQGVRIAIARLDNSVDHGRKTA